METTGLFIPFIRNIMWWGYSPPLDLQNEIHTTDEFNVNILIVGGSDGRHVLKTLARSYLHPERNITYNVIEPSLENIARTILLISTCLDVNLGLQAATRYHLEILGNTLLRPGTAKYLIEHCHGLIDIPSGSIDCPWLDLEQLKYRERDHLESIFKFWERATRDGIPIIDYWDRRIRKSLNTRYDHRYGVFDWDFHMVLKPKGLTNLASEEYRFWRNNGIAFTWLEGEPIRSNPTLLSNIVSEGSGFLHYAYLGDVNNGPFSTWALDGTGHDKKLRSTDVAECELMRAIHEIKTQLPFNDELVMAHRDSSLVNGTIITQMPDSEMELESWTRSGTLERNKIIHSWIDVSKAKIVFHSIRSIDSFKRDEFDVIWIGYNMIKCVPKLMKALKKGNLAIVETPKFLIESRKGEMEKFMTDLRKVMEENNMKGMDETGETNGVIRFCKD